MKTIQDLDLDALEPAQLLKQFSYQENLTSQLDRYKGYIDQNKINEIVLWKINRYAEIDSTTLELLNKIDANVEVMDIDLTEQILIRLLSKGVRGVRLPMASTFLRFRNSNIYQIIDRRAYRVLYGKAYIERPDIQAMIQLYFKYLDDISQLCNRINLPYKDIDRFLYVLDKQLNKSEPI
ncbi:thermostable 8-oxoguanine DNA glycosylase [Lewinella aquimaris]|uniref:Thermostable 8-oxoguanine DNA glycosylase n=1 Tax=Neolewinella aquimaris TaxID=1835722 RepID=A0A840E7V1_9BACT|nr:hypothetical protein [Neolewinella aquimaris]MBB4081110.1 thermostable 8-oxoguanine DNA glycosylase [Neolewinella aquimaris]